MIGGDNAGLPNGRRLFDDTVDIYLRVACGFLVPPAQGGKQLPLGDGVDVNDKAFLPSFPYVAGPTSGFDSEIKQDQPTHAPDPGVAAAGAVTPNRRGGPAFGRAPFPFQRPEEVDV